MQGAPMQGGVPMQMATPMHNAMLGPTYPISAVPFGVPQGALLPAITYRLPSLWLRRAALLLAVSSVACWKCCAE